MRPSWFALSLVLGASAVVVEERAVCTTKFVSNYDNLNAPALVDSLKTVGVYNGLDYNGFSPAAPPAFLGGVIPNTKKNVIVASLTSDILNLGTDSLKIFGTIAAQKPVIGFDLTSFYFGCTLFTPASSATIPLSCTISVAGFYANGKPAPTVKFSFSPTAGILAPSAMKLAVLPTTYRALKNVTIGVDSSQVIVPATALALDSVSHCNY
ncbi:hypothetical protein PFICI_05070 [Pestalotiopsis fici W106-1]|uniref:ML-like domain-containing protein n=1 Tax=Pestalotiopsis fici (strain W106-1 / CGMCC3.15140) TaxID=1229662 RepID=W3XAY2_PESFW|nr:uncharacterized protein PFICI_05070 [Pestalotiopsis fici W106-1]ETS83194.1 hypothetical protein PFICI_05070 [Pestalotiopsis fici W106-1]